VQRAAASAFELGASGHRGGDGRGVLVVHGFTGSPFEMRYLGDALAARGYIVSGPALAGHGEGSPVALDATTWRDWYGSAETAFDALRQRCTRVAVVGLSMGGLLALHLARERGEQLACVGALATPVWLPRHLEAAILGVNRALRAAERVPALAAYARALPPLPKMGGESDVRDAGLRAANPPMPAMPVRALASQLELQRVVRRDLAGVRVPAFVAHARKDHTAPFACAAHIMARLGSREVRGLTLEHSYHVITIDVERERLARAVGDFLDEYV
jgi:carboxylesterase